MSPLTILAAAVFFASPADAGGGEAVSNPVIEPGENVVLDQVPKEPRALADKLERYSESRSAWFGGWHPTKREMLIHTRFGETWQVHRVRAPLADRSQLTFGRENVSGGSGWVSDDAFFFGRDVGGNEQYQLYRQDLGTGNVTLLTDGQSRNTAARLSWSGKWVAYGSTRRNGNDVDIWVQDTSDPKSARMLGELKGGGWEPAAWSFDEKQLAVVNGVSVNETHVFVYDVATGKRVEVLPKGFEGTKVAWGDVRFTADGKGLYASLDYGSEFQKLYRVDLKTFEVKPLTASLDFDIDSFSVSKDGRWLALATNEKGDSVVRVLEVATGKMRPVKELPKGVVFGLTFHHDGKNVALSISSNRGGSDVYSFDAATLKVERWTASETGGLDVSTFAEPQLIEWKSFDGKMISGFLYRPPKTFTGKRPVVIDIHGGPEGQARTWSQGQWNYLVQELGVVMIQPNVRGSTGFGKTFVALDDGFGREGSYKDVSALLDWIATQPDLDASRVMVEGGSYGGFMTLALAWTEAKRIRCALELFGPSNFVTFLEHTSGYRQDLRRVEYGDERDPKMREFLTRIAPMNHVDQMTKPMLVIQGKNDPRVPPSESEQMVASLRKKGTPVWYLLAKDEGHGFAKKTNSAYSFAAGVMFIEKYLLP